MKPGALLFDLDGTLVDSLPDLAAAANRLLAERDRAPLALSEVAGMVGDGVGTLVERVLGARALSATPLAPALTRFVAYYEADIATHTRAFEGVAQALDALAQAGVALAVCSNKFVRASEAVLAATGLLRFFPVVVGGDSLAERKPDAAPLRHALQRLGVAAEAAAMIGDHRNDVLAARAAGTAAIFARYGYGLASLGALVPDAMIDRFADLPAALQAL